MHTLFHNLREKYRSFYRAHQGSSFQRVPMILVPPVKALYKDNVFLFRCLCMDAQHSMGPTQAAKMGEGSL